MDNDTVNILYGEIEIKFRNVTKTNDLNKIYLYECFIRICFLIGNIAFGK